MNISHVRIDGTQIDRQVDTLRPCKVYDMPPDMSGVCVLPCGPEIPPSTFMHMPVFRIEFTRTFYGVDETVERAIHLTEGMHDYEPESVTVYHLGDVFSVAVFLKEKENEQCQ